jgi:hypothetical protein
VYTLCVLPLSNPPILLAPKATNRGFNLRKWWNFRYRVISILLLFITLPILYANNSGSPKVVVANTTILPSRSATTARSTISSSISQIAIDIANATVNLPFIPSFGSEDLLSRLDIVAQKEGEAAKNRAIKDIVKAPENAELKDFLRYPKYDINVPIKYAGLTDMFQTDPSGELIKDELGRLLPIIENVDRDGPLSVPIQRLLVDGIVHIGFTALPGEVGNSYIVGHSSNFASVESNYNYIFKPLEKRSQLGDEFFVYDKDGRELKFRVFEVKEILEEDVQEAYKTFGEKRVVTLQCSILEWVKGYGLKPTKRWLTRGELAL